MRLGWFVFLGLVLFIVWLNISDPIVGINLYEKRGEYSQETTIGPSGEVVRGYARLSDNEYFKVDRFRISNEITQAIWSELERGNVWYLRFAREAARDCKSIGVAWQSRSNGAYGRDFCYDELGNNSVLFKVLQIIQAHKLDEWQVPVEVARRDYENLGDFFVRQQQEEHSRMLPDFKL